MRPVIVWFISNLIFVLTLWFGYHDGISGARNVAAFLVWSYFVVSFLALSKSMQAAMQAKGPPVSPYLDGIVEVAVILFLVWYGHWLMGAAYGFHAIALHGAYRKEAA